jgi:hypothetical protein
MVTSTFPSKGVQTDVSILKHDPDFARDSVNGRFTTIGSNLSWESIKLFKQEKQYNSADILGAFNFQGNTYFFFIDTVYFNISRYNPVTKTFATLFTRTNSDFGFSSTYLIRSCSFWTNISETKLRIYFTDGNTNPWSIDLLDASSQTCDIVDLTFSPKVGTPILDLYQVSNGGSVLCGKYYYAIQAYKPSGISTDWIMMHNPVEVPNQMPINYGPVDYQNIEGGNSTLKSSCKIVLKLLNLTEFHGWYVKIAAFYAIDEFKIDTGRVFYDGAVGTGEYTHSSNVELESILLEKVMKNTISIKKVGVMASNGEINTLGDIEINEMVPDENTIFDNIKFKTRPTIALKRFSNGASTGIESPIVLDKATNNEIYNFTSSGQKKQAQFSEKLAKSSFETLSPRTYKRYNDSVWNKDNKNYGPGFADYTNPHIAFRNKIYRSGEPLRLAIVPFDLYGKPLRPIWIGDLESQTGYYANAPMTQLASFSSIMETVKGTVWFQKNKYGTSEFAATDGDFFVNESTNPYRLQLDFNWLEIIGLDLKDFISNGVPLISGFSIVQAEPVVKRIVTEGFFTRITKSTLLPNLVPFYSCSTDLDTPPFNGDGWILIYSPEYFFNGEMPKAGDKIHATAWENTTYANWMDSIWEYDSNKHLNLFKLYFRRLFDSAVYDNVGTIEKIIELPNLPETESIVVEGLGTIANAGRGRNSGGVGMGNKKGLLIKLKDETGLYQSLSASQTNTKNVLEYWTYRIERVGYGFASQDDSDLANTIYKFIGHYQKTDATFFQNIFRISDQSYKCDISVYGGQYYANVFEVMRISKFTNTNGNSSNTVYMPVTSKINLRMRTGVRHSRNRILGEASGSHINLGGIGIASNRGQFEDFLYGTSYLSKNSGRELVPVPNDFEINTKLTNVIYWSEKQALQGDQDYFRKIYSDSYAICDVNGKNIRGLEFTKDKLIVFQQNAIGFLPYMERMLANMSNNTNLVVSYGSIFPKYESIDNLNGIDHNLMKITTPSGIVFYNSSDGTLNILGEGIEDFARKLGIVNLVKTYLTSIKSLMYSKETKCLMVLSGNKILEVSMNPFIVNGIQHLDNTYSISIYPFGEKVAIIDKLERGGGIKIYTESESGTVKLNSYYSILLVVGADKRDIFKKIFDNIIIHTLEGLQPETIQFFVGNLQSIQETLANNEYVTINGSTIYMAVPFIDIPNSEGILQHSRVADSSVCAVLLRSLNRFALESLICEYRNAK